MLSHGRPGCYILQQARKIVGADLDEGLHPALKKKQECKFSKTRYGDGVLRTPTHRTKTKTSDGWAQFHTSWVGNAGG